MSFENSKAKWIWINNSPSPEEYGYFEERFTFGGEKMSLLVAADTDCLVYLNGVRIDSCFFRGYPFCKYYNEIDLSSLCRAGENILSFTVRYEGVNSACTIEDGAALIFSLVANGRELLFSSEDTPSAPSAEYIHHAPRHITSQLGLASDMITPKDGICYSGSLSKSTVIERDCALLPRPLKRTYEDGRVFAKKLCGYGEHIIYDLGREEVGYLFLKVNAASECKLKVAYGEHLDDGCVRYLVGGRNFSLDFHCIEGENYFEQAFVRVGARYLEIICEDAPVPEIMDIGIVPTLYPLTERVCTLSGIEGEIYKTSVRTLRLSLHSHYEDCPWREQALYVLDSRNQMLCGYTAFRETEAARGSLVFMSKGKRPDDALLELTYPAVNTPAIPFFSITYPIAVAEYIEHTGDISILAETLECILGIISDFTDRIDEKSGLVQNLPSPYWNFYEWSKGNDGHSGLYNEDGKTVRADLILNCALVLALESTAKMLTLVNKDTKRANALLAYKEQVTAAVERELFDIESGIFRSSTNRSIPPSIVGNAFALLIGLGDERTLSAVKSEDGLTPATLSMKAFVYDAIIKAEGEDAAKEYILSDIEKNYSYMLKKGATSFWETIGGADDFGGAGSLCHGWSAIPIIYYARYRKECFGD